MNGQQAGYTPDLPYVPPPEVKRPRTLLAACIMAYVGGCIPLVFAFIVMIGSLVDERFSNAVRSAPTGVLVLGGFLVPLVLVEGVVAALLAFITQHGLSDARGQLTGLGVLACLHVPFAAPYIGLAIMLLWTKGAEEWLRAQKLARGEG